MITEVEVDDLMVTKRTRSEAGKSLNEAICSVSANALEKKAKNFKEHKTQI